MKRSFHGGHSLHGATMDMRKKAPRDYGLDRGASIGALWAGRIKRAITVWLGGVALGGNPRKLLTRWCCRKKPRASGTRTGQERAWAGGQELSALSAQTRPAPNCSPLALAVRVSLSLLATRGRAYRLFDLNFSPKVASAAPTNTRTDRPRAISPITNSSE